MLVADARSGGLAWHVTEWRVGVVGRRGCGAGGEGELGAGVDLALCESRQSSFEI